AQLMELREPEALRLLDHYDRRLRHVYANFDHGRGDEDLRLAAREALHRLVAVARLHASVDEADALAESCLQELVALLGGRQVQLFRFVDQWADPVGAGTGLDCAPDRLHHLVDAPDRDRARIDRLTARGFGAELGYFHVAEIG